METATLKLEDAAAYLGIGRATAYRLAKTGELMPGVPVLHIGSRYRVPTAKLRAAVEGQTGAAS